VHEDDHSATIARKIAQLRTPAASREMTII
jgi:hypothetical protein